MTDPTTEKELDKQIAEIKKDLRILELEREILKLRMLLHEKETTIITSSRAWDP